MGRPSSQLLTSKPFTGLDVEGGGADNLGTMGKNVPCPFSIEPYSGEITAGSEQIFTVRFAPQEVSFAGNNRNRIGIFCYRGQAGLGFLAYTRHVEANTL